VSFKKDKVRLLV